LYYKWDKAVSKSECEFLIEDCLKSDAKKAFTNKDEKEILDDKIRKTDIRWIRSGSFIQYSMMGFLADANSRIFRYDITGHEQIQFGTYSKDDHYLWHIDAISRNVSNPSGRKLTTSILLSDPKDFEGGEFEIFSGAEKPEQPLQFQGSVCVMDCTDWHRITPVTRGVRHSLVMWSHGPNFK